MTPGIKKALLLTSVVVVLLLLSSVFGQKGFLHLLKLRQEKVLLGEKNALLQRENAQLRKKIQALKRDDQALEKLVREELGWVREGEIIYRFKSPMNQEKAELSRD